MARERAIRSMLDKGMNLTEIARATDVSRQAIWEFCGRRGWLSGEDQCAYSERIAERELRRRARRRELCRRARG